MTVASVGDVTEATVEITSERIELFADLTTDDHPLHLDDGYAEQTFFGERVAHGMLTASIMSAAMTKLSGLTVYLSQTLEFENPVYAGETVRGRAEVVEALGDDRFRVETTAESDNGIVLSGEAVILIKPAPS